MLGLPEEILRDTIKLVLCTLSKRRIQSVKRTYLETCINNLATEERERERELGCHRYNIKSLL